MRWFRLILVWFPGVIGILGIVGCLAVVCVARAQLAEIFYSSNALRDSSFQTNIAIVGANRSGLLVHVLRRDWRGEEPVFHSTWRNTELRWSADTAPRKSALGFAGFIDRGSNRHGGGILRVFLRIPLWAIASLSISATVPAVVVRYRIYRRGAGNGFSVVFGRAAGEGQSLAEAETAVYGSSSSAGSLRGRK